MRSKLRVAIIESQAPEEFTRPMTGKPMSDLLALCEFSSAVQVAVARASFAAGLLSLYQRAAEPTAIPLVHLIVAGRQDRFTLTSREAITWKSLAAALSRLDCALNGRLHVSIQSPGGFHGLAEAFVDPPFALIGPAAEPSFRQAALTVAVYAHQLSAGTAPEPAAARAGESAGVPIHCLERKSPARPALPPTADELAALLS